MYLAVVLELFFRKVIGWAIPAALALSCTPLDAIYRQQFTSGTWQQKTDLGVSKNLTITNPVDIHLFG